MSTSVQQPSSLLTSSVTARSGLVRSKSMVNPPNVKRSANSFHDVRYGSATINRKGSDSKVNVKVKPWLEYSNSSLPESSSGNKKRPVMVDEGLKF